VYEEALFALLNRLHDRYRLPALALSGGCAMNSVANGRIRLRTPFQHVYVQAASGDAGGALGAALSVWHRQDTPAARQRGPAHDHAGWGPAFDATQIHSALSARAAELRASACVTRDFTDTDVLCGEVAELLVQGRVVGWFQGRMEWGPRALGNRSILCDPRRADMQEILNRRIKRRESFRPFAPAILREAVGEWFEQDDDVPFMSQVFQVRATKRPLIPAVTHVDGSGRLQTVDRRTLPRFHALITAFAARTGVPLVLNTSFNENEPIVCRPEEALDCFLRTGMDALVLGDTLVLRGAGP
jgi:carbamoyltransferase